jgi:dipeptidyl-peptidase-4
MKYTASKKSAIVLLQLMLLLFSISLEAKDFQWTTDGKGIIRMEDGQLVLTTLSDNKQTVLVSSSQFTVNGTALEPDDFTFSTDQNKLLVFVNTARVWRYNTRGDYWLLNRKTGQWKQVGKRRPSQSLMFAKFSPDFNKVAYVSEQNIYVEDLQTGIESALTKGGNRKLINGTFDWVYEEEFYCTDGFKWSADSKSIAYWQVNAAGTRDFLMINNTDSIYSQVKPVEYPKVGQPPSAVKIGVVSLATKVTKWMLVPGDPRQHYIPRMDWKDGEVIIQQLNRRQQISKLFLCNAVTGQASEILSEKDEGWIEVMQNWDEDYKNAGWDWLENGRSFLWASEKDGWRHLYVISKDGKNERLITKGNFDVIDIARIDEKSGFIYYLASPDNATQKYLYRSRLNGTDTPERLSPAGQSGTHNYDIAPGAAYAFHIFTNHKIPYMGELISLPDHNTLHGDQRLKTALQKAGQVKGGVEFIRITTADKIEMDAAIIKPINFDVSKKYPVVFYVYSEPASQIVNDVYGVCENFLYDGNMAADGYVQICIDNRGTPAPKGREWRKSIYRKIGVININDQASAAREVLKWPYIDSSRVAVWGWSGGGSATLNLLFRYPEIYKTGISIAAVALQLTYDNIYQERYMGLPSENMEDFIKGSPITYAKNLKGNLLYIHGTGDDNVHYQNAELLINELIKHNRQFRIMPYPNRTHGISEGEGTFEHLQTLYTNYLRESCAPGGK